MASVDSVYVGPLALDDCPAIIRQLRDGEEPLPEKQLVRMPVASALWAQGGPPPGEPPGGTSAEGPQRSQSDEKGSET
jgi:hypothetical protein